MEFKHNIPLCYFPTTIVLIDDSEAFTDMLQLLLSSNHITHTENNPKHALAWINSNGSLELFDLFKNDKASNLDDSLENICIDLEKIHQLAYNENRFSLPSVAIVDHAMPLLSGLELCEILNKQPIRKLMLTGHADRVAAIEALNEKTIDAFFFKSTKDKEVNKLRTAISEQEKYYFQELSRQYGQPLLTNRNLFKNSVFIDLFNQIIQAHKIVEFYLLDKWGSYLMINELGEPFILAVRDEDECHAYYEIANQSAVPLEEDVLKNIENKKVFPFLYTEEDLEIPADKWKPYLHSAKQIGEHPWYYSLIEGKRAKSLVQKNKISTVQQHRNNLK